MTRATELLEKATPLPWEYDTSPDDMMIAVHNDDRIAALSLKERPDDAALIVYAVNHLPDYEAAVEALANLIEVAQMYRFADTTGVSADALHGAEQAGRAALHRLRPEVPA